MLTVPACLAAKCDELTICKGSKPWVKYNMLQDKWITKKTYIHVKNIDGIQVPTGIKMKTQANQS